MKENDPRRLPNEACREQAVAAWNRRDYLAAMRWYNLANARTIGHGRSERYQAAAREAAKEGGINYNPLDFADDCEAVAIWPPAGIAKISAT